MAIKVAINGYGRIGKCVLRAIYEQNLEHEFELVAINDASGAESTAYHTRYDTTHGRFTKNVSIKNDQLIINNNNKITITKDRDPAKLPWHALGVDLVFECTGKFISRESAGLHLAAGAKKVLISAPGEDVDATIVYGVNEDKLKQSDKIVSNASCTTNCLAPLAKILHENFGIESGLVNTIHAYTKDQLLLDGNHKDLRRSRAAAHSIIPTKTGAASAVGLVLPELAGKLDGFAMRVPTLNVSVIDLTFKPMRKVTVAEINQVLLASQNDIIMINQDPLVSCDFNHSSASSIIDLTQTRVLGDLVKVIAWYDNEWAFACRMLDTARCMMK